MNTQPENPPVARDSSSVRLSVAAAARSPYAPPSLAGPIDLFLDANEGALSRGLASSEAMRRYPHAAPLERMIAARYGLSEPRVLVTAGGDDAIDRACRACLEPGRSLVVAVPTFEMIARSAQMLGASVETAPWPGGAFPIDAMLERIDDRTSMIAVVSPNNPTGAVATARDLQRLALAAPQALLLVDLAYAEFADIDLTDDALALPNAVVVRTFSKSAGLAGLRVGYALGEERVIRAMRAVSGPYPVSALSLEVAAKACAISRDDARAATARVRTERVELAGLLAKLGAAPLPSQGNFVLAGFGDGAMDASWCWRALGGLGISVRRFPSTRGLEHALRISCPGDPGAFERLCAGLRAALAPEALLFDMDGVLADVSGSYRAAIAQTAQSFGVRVTPADIAAAKAEGNANNDWVVTHRLVLRAGVSASLDDVTARFEALYHGTAAAPGLCAAETLIPQRETLERLSQRFALGIVTGRPRRDCERFLDRFGLRALFRSVVCMEDAPLKPDPAPVRAALDALGTRSAWLLGDTPDDIAAARGAGVVPIGFVPPGCDGTALTDTLDRAGASRTLNDFNELLQLLSSSMEPTA